MYILRSTCRGCDSPRLEVVVSLGELPLPGALLLPSQLEDPEHRYPLDLALCLSCGLLQLLETVPPGDIYNDGYRSIASASATYAEHARALAEQLIHDWGLDGNSLVIEAGSNDGFFLRQLQARGVPTLGIEPAPGPAAESRRAGIATISGFLNRELAYELARDGRRATVLVANDLLPRVPDLHGFIAGVSLLLEDHGLAVLEFPYVCDLIALGNFDFLDHEHLCYFSLTSLLPLVAEAGLNVWNVEHTLVHGGSLRVYLSKTLRPLPAVEQVLHHEASEGVREARFYAGFARRAETVRARLLRLLDSVKAETRHIVGYGAAGHGSTLLNYCGIGDQYLDYVVDPNPRSHGCFLPGVHLPVLHTDRLLSNRPDYVLLFTWSMLSEVMEQQEAYLSRGGRVIVSTPDPAII